jgi:hypothetical protein
LSPPLSRSWSLTVNCATQFVCVGSGCMVDNSVENHLLPIGNSSLSGGRVRRSDLDLVAELAKLFGEVLRTIHEELWF